MHKDFSPQAQAFGIICLSGFTAHVFSHIFYLYTYRGIVLYKGLSQCPSAPQSGVAGGGEYNPSFSTEENRLIFSYGKSCCIFYKLSTINCLTLWSHGINPVACCSSCYLSHSIWVSFYVVHVYYLVYTYRPQAI